MWPGQLVTGGMIAICGLWTWIEKYFINRNSFPPPCSRGSRLDIVGTRPVYDHRTCLWYNSIKENYTCFTIINKNSLRLYKNCKEEKYEVDETSENCRKTKLQWYSWADNLTKQQQRVIKKKISLTIFYQTRLLIMKGKV